MGCAMKTVLFSSIPLPSTTCSHSFWGLFVNLSVPSPSHWASLNSGSLRFKKSYLLGLWFWENISSLPLLRSPGPSRPRCPTGLKTNRAGLSHVTHSWPKGNAASDPPLEGAQSRPKHTSPASPATGSLPVDYYFWSTHQILSTWNNY